MRLSKSHKPFRGIDQVQTSHRPCEAAASSGNKGPGPWSQDSDRSTAGTRLSDWHASGLTNKTGPLDTSQSHTFFIRQSGQFGTLLSDVVQALLLKGLVINEALDFGGGAVHIRVLQGGKTAQDNHWTSCMID